MVTCTDVQGNKTGAVMSFEGLSTDTKPFEWDVPRFGDDPTPVGNASEFFEMDTFNLYKFDGQHNQWRTKQ